MASFIDRLISDFNEACILIIGEADTWAATNSGLIYNDPGLDHTVASPPPPDNKSEAQKTWEAYKTKLDQAKTLYATNMDFSGDGHNNDYFQDPTQVDPDSLAIEGRAGFLHRYAMAYLDLASLYVDHKFTDKNGEQVLIPDDFVDINSDFPNLLSIYEGSLMSDGKTPAQLAAYFYQNKYKIVPEGMGNGWYPDGALAFPNLDNYLDTYPNWENEKAALKSLVTGLELRGNIAQNPVLRKAFALRELLSAMQVPVIQRDLSSWPDLATFYAEKGLNDLIDIFNIGLNKPGDFDE